VLFVRQFSVQRRDRGMIGRVDPIAIVILRLFFIDAGRRARRSKVADRPDVNFVALRRQLTRADSSEISHHTPRQTPAKPNSAACPGDAAGRRSRCVGEAFAWNRDPWPYWRVSDAGIAPTAIARFAKLERLLRFAAIRQRSVRLAPHRFRERYAQATPSCGPRS